MANVHGILAVIGSVLAALTATILIGGAVLIPAAFAIGAGIYIALREKDNKLVFASGALAALFGIVAALGALGGVGAGGFGASFSAIGGTLANAFAILACLEVTASSLKTQWNNMPQVAAIAVAVALAAAVILGFVLHDQLANQGGAVAYIVAVLSLAGLYPAILALKS